MGFILCQNNNIVGVFETFLLAKNEALGIIEHGWADNFKIIEFKKNSCVRVDTTEVKGKFNKNKTSDEKVIQLGSEDEDTLESSSDEENETISESALQEKKKQIAENRRNINLLKIKKEKLEESKQKYNVDLDLYQRFKANLEENISFEIPELFREKYKIFHRLEQENKLSWENFCEQYKEKDFHGNMQSIFEANNSFENKFLESIESDSDKSVNDSSELGFSNEDSSDIIEIIEVVKHESDSESDSD